MDARIKQIAIIFLAACIGHGCEYHLDVTGVAGTDVPIRDRFLDSQEWTAVNGEYEIVTDTTFYSFFVAGDTHVGSIVNLEQMLQKAVEDRAVGVSIAGDVSTGREEDIVRADSILNAYPQVPAFVIPGNHDLYFGGWETFFALFGPSVYTVTIRSEDAQDMFLFLDSGSGTLGVDQLAWLEELLEEERTAFRYVIVITHLNLVNNRLTGSTGPLNEEVVMLFDLFTEHDVQMVIQGHDHRRYETSFGTTTYITLDALKDGDPNASFLELQVNQNGIETVFHEM
jgi:hypothetical protein